MLEIKSYKIINCPRKRLDLTNFTSVEKWFKKNKPDIVINCAGRVGGILDNSKYQDEYLYINTIIGLNLVATQIETPSYINEISSYPNKIKNFWKIVKKKNPNVSSEEIFSSVYHIVLKKYN